jgi:hypothetical protein
MVYILDEARRSELAAAAVATLGATGGVDLVATREDGEAVVRSGRGTLRFAPGGDLTDRRGRSWRVDGDRGVIGADTYPDGLNRLWSALECPHSGDVLASAAPGFEFVDWGGAEHVGGGSHGSLHRDDSEGVLLLCGIAVPERTEWALTDVAPLVLDHFGVASTG